MSNLYLTLCKQQQGWIDEKIIMSTCYLCLYNEYKLYKIICKLAMI